MKDNTGRTNVSILTITALLMAWACQSPSVAEAAIPPRVIDRYENLARQAVAEINLAGIQQWVEELDAPDVQQREAAIRRLRQETSLAASAFLGGEAYDPAGSVEERRGAVKVWKGYAQALEKAVEEKIPPLLREPTPHNRSSRGRAAMFVGVSVPHPAWLPLLRQIVENEQEPRYVRYWAVTSISQIPHEGLMPYLIEQLDGDLWGRAAEQFHKLTGESLPLGNDRATSPAQQVAIQWWREHKDDFVYERTKVMWEY